MTSDWLLWVDSDIELTPQVMQTLWDIADKDTMPVVTGVYFISKSTEQMMMVPMPCVFFEGEHEHQIHYIHPLPENEVLKVDIAGMGLVLMHRSVVEKLRATFPDESLFAEVENVGDKYISEDVVFFRKLQRAGIPVYAHTGALVRHFKRFALNEAYYRMYWEHQELTRNIPEEGESPRG